VLVLQLWIVLVTTVIYALWLDSGSRRKACWIPLGIFLLSPQILLYSRQAVNELFVGLLTVAVMLLGERRGRRAALALGSLVGLALCTKLAAGLLGIVALGYLLRERGRERIAPSLARATVGFALVAVPLLVFAALQRGSWLLDNTGAFNLSGMTLAEWRALPDAATRQAVGMARWWETFSSQPGAYLAGTATRAI
jgi:4-amino-4-deoxy-L-arabinose transferase-like glycosyltransferase